MKQMKDRVNKAAKAKAPKPKKNITLIVIVLVVVAAITFGLFYALSTAFKTEKYYVLGQDAPAKTLVTVEMLVEQETSAGTSPQNAIGIDQVQRGQVFTKYPLQAGDILSVSNTGVGVSLTSGIPDDWVITSFNISSDDAVGGKVGRGEYFDIMGVNVDGSRYLFLNVLALDVTTTSKNSSDVNDGAIGVDMQYIIGMPPEDAAILHAAYKQFETIKIVKSPTLISYETRDTSPLERIFVLGTEVALRDLYVGTDSTFSEVKRDDSGRPVNKRNCAKELVSPMSLCDDIEYTAADAEDEVREEYPEVDAPLVPANPVDTGEPVDPENTEDTEGTEKNGEEATNEEDKATGAAA